MTENDMAHLDWVEASGTELCPDGLSLLDSFEDVSRGVKVASLRPRASGFDSWMTVAGARGPMRNALQALVTRSMPPESMWIVSWLLGRWPRGRILASIPLSEGTRVHRIGITAPLMPTRLALSQGPVPFDAATVSHFKALHVAVDEPGLLGCSLTLREGRFSELKGRWDLRADRLRPVMEHWGLGQQVELAEAVLEGLGEGMDSVPGLAVEAGYTPDPSPTMTLEVGPLPLRSVLQLAQHIYTTDDARGLAAAAKMLSQRQAFRVSLDFGASGVERLTLHLAVGPPPRGKW